MRSDVLIELGLDFGDTVNLSVKILEDDKDGQLKLEMGEDFNWICYEDFRQCYLSADPKLKKKLLLEEILKLQKQLEEIEE